MEYNSSVNKYMDNFIKSELLSLPNVAHLFTTRRGGVSDGVFAEMNLAAGSGDIRDDFENVIKNHDICARALGYTAHDVCRTYQAHTANVEVITSAHKGVGLYLPPFDRGVDGIVTAERGVVLSVRGADCAMLLAADAAHGVIGALHSGWRGTLQNAAKNLIAAMISLGASAESTYVALGPSIRGCCYEVGSELYEQFTAVGYDMGFVPEQGKEGKYMLDLTVIIKKQLTDEGIYSEHIDMIPVCTCCNDDFFSHRRMGVNRGTGGGMIVLK